MIASEINFLRSLKPAPIPGSMHRKLIFLVEKFRLQRAAQHASVLPAIWRPYYKLRAERSTPHRPEVTYYVTKYWEAGCRSDGQYIPEFMEPKVY